MRINDDLYKNARAYCDKNSIRFKDFLEDAIENAMFETDVPVKKVWIKNRLILFIRIISL